MKSSVSCASAHVNYIFKNDQYTCIFPEVRILDPVRRAIMIDFRYLLNTSCMLYFYPLKARASTEVIHL